MPHAGSAATLADEHEGLAGSEVARARFELFEGDVDGAGYVAGGELARGSNVEELESLAGLQASIQVLRSDCDHL